MGMKLYSAAQMREADARAAAAGVPTSQLMDAAGAAVAEAVAQRYPAARRVVVLCGVGNNGGDGYVAAERLLRRGVSVQLFELTGAGDRPGDAADARRSYLAAGGHSQPLEAGTASELPALLARPTGQADAAPVVIDALFGSGLNRPLTGWLGALAEGLADSGARVVSVDVPSGLNADLAGPIGPHVRAHLTVELAGHKPAALFYPARAAYGETVLADIGIPAQVLEASGDIDILEAASVRDALPHRRPDDHKYGAGTVCVVAGSQRYLGAAELACRGAWRGGAGLVTQVGDHRHPAAWPETILEPHDWTQVANAPSGAWPPPGLEAKRAQACVVGPGLEPRAARHLGAMLAWAPGPVVLDAGALEPAAIAGCRQQLADAAALLTPHAGEAERLLADLAPEHSGLVRSDPLSAAAHLAQLLGAVVVLKGPTTVIAAPDGRRAVSTRGTPAMASGGTGDVLAGLLGALLAAPGGAPSLFERARLGVWLHGVAGELAAASVGDALVASDLVATLPEARRSLARLHSE